MLLKLKLFNTDSEKKDCEGYIRINHPKKLKKCSLATDLIFQIQQRTIAFQIAEFEKELEKLEKKEG